MTMYYSTALQNFILDSGLGTAFDTTGKVNVYTGAMPSVGAAVAGKASIGNEIPTGTLEGTLTLSSDAFAAAASGAIVLNAVTSDTSVDATGSPGYGVFYRTGDTALSSRAGASDRRWYFLIAATFLTADPGAGGTTVNVSDCSSFPTSGTVLIGTEQIIYTGKTGSTALTGCTRGANATSAAAHAIDSSVQLTTADMVIDSGKLIQGGTLAINGWTINHPG